MCVCVCVYLVCVSELSVIRAPSTNMCACLCVGGNPVTKESGE